jgi:putative addiction module component (TIGR02574 family)
LVSAVVTADGKLECQQLEKGHKMSTETREIIDRAMELPAVEKARLVDQLLSSLDEPDDAIDALWRKEVEDRIQAYQEGKLKSVSLSDVLAKYRK